MGRFDNASSEPIAYSDKRPDRCTPAPGPAFVLPGETQARELGADPDMPPARDHPHGQHPVTIGFAHLKGR